MNRYVYLLLVGPAPHPARHRCESKDLWQISRWYASKWCGVKCACIVFDQENGKQSCLPLSVYFLFGVLFAAAHH